MLILSEYRGGDSADRLLVALKASGESITAIVRFGLRYLPGLDDAPVQHLEATLLEQLKKASKRRRKTTTSKP